MRRKHETGLIWGGGAVLALGLLIVSLGFFWPLARVVAARWWRAVPCAIESCELSWTSQRDDHGREQGTWYVLARYRYQVDGLHYVGERFELGPWEGGGLAWRQAALARLRAADPSRCWVDPGDPHRAVLERGFDPAHCGALLGLVPMAIGGLIAGFGLRKRLHRLRRLREGGYRFSAVGGATESAGVPVPVVSRMVEDPIGLDAPRRPRHRAPPSVRGARMLQARLRRGPGKAIGALLGCALFYGIVLRHLCALISRSVPDGWAWLVYAPFVAGAAGLVGFVIIRVVTSRAPCASLDLEPPIVWPGATATAHWRLPDGVRVDRLTIDLVGEEVLLHPGSGARREVHGYVPVPLVEVIAPSATGAVRLTLPAAIMPSFVGNSAQVLWSLALRLDIPNAMDGLDRYTIEIHPCPPEGA